MKNRLIILITFSYFCFNLFSENLFLKTDMYKVTKLNNTTYLINDNDAATSYLLLGSNKALLIDTGIGDGNLASLVSNLTNLPVSVILTHGHSDHIGASYQFDEAFINSSDTTLYKSFFNPAMRATMYNLFINPDEAKALGSNRMTNEEIDNLFYSPLARLKFVNDGDIIDLGGRKLEIASLPGHTAGSIMVIDRKNKYLFSGDAIISWFLLCFDESLTPEVYYKNLCKTMPKFNGLKTIYTGHDDIGAGLPISFISSVRKHLEDYFKGKVKSEQTEFLGTQAKLYMFNDWRLYTKP